MASEGTRGAKVNTLSSIIALIVLVGFDVVLIPLIGILGAAITLIFAYLIAVFNLLLKRRVLSARSDGLIATDHDLPNDAPSSTSP